jgi:hypothetical protein
MSALEREIVGKFRQLDDEARRRLLAELEREAASVQPLPDDALSLADWLEGARALREEMRARYGQLSYSISDLIRDTHEERLDDILDRY